MNPATFEVAAYSLVTAKAMVNRDVLPDSGMDIPDDRLSAFLSFNEAVGDALESLAEIYQMDPEPEEEDEEEA